MSPPLFFVMMKRPFPSLILAFLAFALGWSLVSAQEPISPTPTIDRLAPPPTVPSPTQADEGAYLYWLNCQPCHGDYGQGLTDEWRAQYPMEDQYCWNSGCHGQRPYEDGFILPTSVPAVVGDNSLARFQTVGQLYAYIRVAMPFEYPGVLPDDEYLAIAAFLMRENGLWDGTSLTDDTIYELNLRTAPTATPAVGSTPTPIPTPAVEAAPRTGGGILFVAGLFCLLLAGATWLWRRKMG